MGIAAYIREIGRGREGARALTRDQANDLMGQVLDGGVTDLEVGAFCLAMRIKGETAEEMAGFLDAARARISPIAAEAPAVVIPSYNGARRLPVLTPLLACLLAREGLAVMVHGTPTESARIPSEAVFAALGIAATRTLGRLQAGQVQFVPTEQMCPGLKRLLDVRRTVGLRNPAHSLVKLLQPVRPDALLISSYTHPEYARSMAATLQLTGTRALLLRGTEGEPVADARRQPQIDAFVNGIATTLVDAHSGPITELPALPEDLSATATARYIDAVLKDQTPVPAPIAAQVRAALQALALDPTKSAP